MGFLLRSAVGLGAVYFAMFGHGAPTSEIAAPADPCRIAADASLRGDSGLAAQWAAASCAAKFAGRAQRLTAPLVAATTLSPPPAPRPAATPRPQNGTLSEADLQEPWFGPAHLTRKAPFRG
jgi:hypothetical protein